MGSKPYSETSYLSYNITPHHNRRELHQLQRGESLISHTNAYCFRYRISNHIPCTATYCWRIAVVWDMTPCILVSSYQCLRINQLPALSSKIFFLPHNESFIFVLNVAPSCRTTRRHIPEDNSDRLHNVLLITTANFPVRGPGQCW